MTRRLYGPPNRDDGEWGFPTREGWQLRAWTFGNKLVVAGELPGSEWN